MFSSTIIPTVGRESLAHAVESVLRQQFDQDAFEVIVVNDSGKALPDAAWKSAPNVTILETQQRERCFARNAGAAVAHGQYLHFLDDDDWLLPGALQAIYNLSQREPDAAWLYGGICIADRHGQTLAQINSGLIGSCAAQFVGGAWAPIQVSWIANRMFFDVGGFDQRMTPVIEDLDLCRKVAMAGAFANCRQLLGCLRRDVEWGSVTTYRHGPEINRQARDALLEQPQAWQRLMRTAPHPYWKGRVAHTYISGALLNARRRRLWTATSRLLHLLLTLLVSLPQLWHRSFWSALRADQVPNTLYDVLVALEQKQEATAP